MQSRARPHCPTIFIMSPAPLALRQHLDCVRFISRTAHSHGQTDGYGQNELWSGRKITIVHASLSATGESYTLTLAVMSVGRGIGPDG